METRSPASQRFCVTASELKPTSFELCSNIASRGVVHIASTLVILGNLT